MGYRREKVNMGFVNTINNISNDNVPKNQNKSSKNGKGKNGKINGKSPFGNDSKIISEGVPVSIKLNKTVQKAFKDERLATGDNASTIATKLLNNLYDPNTKKFNVDIPTKEILEYKATSFTLPAHLKKALVKGAADRNMSVYEYFNEIIKSLIKE